MNDNCEISESKIAKCIGCGQSNLRHVNYIYYKAQKMENVNIFTCGHGWHDTCREFWLGHLRCGINIVCPKCKKNENKKEKVPQLV